MAKRSVLIIDKDEDIVSLLAEELQGKNYEVEVSADGASGIEKAAETRPGIIILCLELDDMSGYVVCKKLKGAQETADIPVIITSRDATEKDFERHRRLKVAAQDYIMKPFENAEILRRIENHVGFDVDENIYEKFEEKLDSIFEEKVTDEQLTLKDKEIQNLRHQLDETKRELLETKKRLSADDGDDGELDRLKVENEGLTGELETLRQRLEEAREGGGGDGEAEARARELEDRLAEVEAEKASALKDLESRIAQVESEKEALQDELNIQSAGAVDAEESADRMQKLEMENRKLQNAISDFKTRLEVREKNLKELSEFKYEVELRQAEEGELVTKLHAENEEKDEALLKNEREISDMKRALQMAQAKAQRLQDLTEKLEAETSDYKGRLEALEEEKNGRVAELEGRVSELEERLAGAEEEGSGLKGQVEEAARREEELQGRLRDLEEERGVLESEKESLEGRLAEAQEEAEAKGRDLEALRDDFATLKDTIRDNLRKTLESLGQ